jgi:hypothetical protein
MAKLVKSNANSTFQVCKSRTTLTSQAVTEASTTVLDNYAILRQKHATPQKLTPAKTEHGFVNRSLFDLNSQGKQQLSTLSHKRNGDFTRTESHPGRRRTASRPFVGDHSFSAQKRHRAAPDFSYQGLPQIMTVKQHAKSPLHPASANKLHTINTPLKPH